MFAFIAVQRAKRKLNFILMVEKWLQPQAMGMHLLARKCLSEKQLTNYKQLALNCYGCIK